MLERFCKIWLLLTSFVDGFVHSPYLNAKITVPKIITEEIILLLSRSSSNSGILFMTHKNTNFKMVSMVIMITKVKGMKHLAMLIIKHTTSGNGPIHILRTSNPTTKTSYKTNWNQILSTTGRPGSNFPIWKSFYSETMHVRPQLGKANIGLTMKQLLWQNLIFQKW